MKQEKIQQFHLSAKSAREQVTKSMSEPHGMLARDYQGMIVSNVRVAKNVGGQPNVPVNGRKLYNIYLKRKK